MLLNPGTSQIFLTRPFSSKLISAVFGTARVSPFYGYWACLLLPGQALFRSHVATERDSFVYTFRSAPAWFWGCGPSRKLRKRKWLEVEPRHRRGVWVDPLAWIDFKRGPWHHCSRPSDWGTDFMRSDRYHVQAFDPTALGGDHWTKPGPDLSVFHGRHAKYVEFIKVDPNYCGTVRVANCATVWAACFWASCSF